jgi:hypothetical protein
MQQFQLDSISPTHNKLAAEISACRIGKEAPKVRRI